jgi:hypothetical protein
MEDVVLPDGALEFGAEVARGASGVVRDATLHGERVWAKVCPAAVLPMLQRWHDPAPCSPTARATLPAFASPVYHNSRR